MDEPPVGPCTVSTPLAIEKVLKLPAFLIRCILPLIVPSLLVSTEIPGDDTLEVYGMDLHLGLNCHPI
jgi:hypothetical protein